MEFIIDTKDSKYYFTEDYEAYRMELSVNEDEYVGITCKDGSHMVLSDVKELYCAKIIKGDEYEKNQIRYCTTACSVIGSWDACTRTASVSGSCKDQAFGQEGNHHGRQQQDHFPQEGKQEDHQGCQMEEQQ